MTPGTVHHEVHCDRLHGYLIETNCREFIGARGAAKGHKQKWSTEPTHGLQLQIRTKRPALVKHSLGKLVKFGLPDNDYGHAVLALHVLADLLATENPAKKELPLFVMAYQDWRKGFAPQQCWQVPYDPYLGAEFLLYLKTSYRYDLLDKPIALHSYNIPVSTPQVAGPAGGSVHLPLQAGTSPATPLFD